MAHDATGLWMRQSYFVAWGKGYCPLIFTTMENFLLIRKKAAVRKKEYLLFTEEYNLSSLFYIASLIDCMYIVC